MPGMMPPDWQSSRAGRHAEQCPANVQGPITAGLVRRSGGSLKFVERENATDRHRNARKARKTYRLSKDWRYHEAVTFLSL